MKRLLILGLWLFGTSCILGPDIEEELLVANSPPKIVVENVIPEDSGWFALDISEDCAPVEFRILLVKDWDVRDSLYYAWFVNWNPGDTEPYAGWFFSNTTGEVTRAGPNLTIPLSEFTVDEAYSLRVFIADRPAEMGEDTIVFPADEDGEYDVHEWSFIARQGEGYCVAP